MRKIFFFFLFLVFLSGGVATAALVDNGDTVTDTATGLMWQKATAPGTYTWQQALAYAEALPLAGHTDWRLPNRNELQSLVDYSRFTPSIDPLLAPHTETSIYWSSTTYADYTHDAWHVDFGYGYIRHDYKSSSYCVRAVRGGQTQLPGTVVVNPDPNSVNAPWTLTGPNGYSHAGIGDQTLTNLTPGDYTLTWGHITDFIKPSPSTQTLTSGGTITFTGTYRPKKPGLPWLLLLLGN